LMREKLLGYDGTNGVTTEVLSSRRTTAVAVETRDGVGATRLQYPADDVSVSHETSIADGPDPIGTIDLPGTPILAFCRQIARKKENPSDPGQSAINLTVTSDLLCSEHAWTLGARI